MLKILAQFFFIGQIIVYGNHSAMSVDTLTLAERDTILADPRGFRRRLEARVLALLRNVALRALYSSRKQRYETNQRGYLLEAHANAASVR